MSFQLVCDNCGFSQIVKPISNMISTSPPTNWQVIYGSERVHGYSNHLCPECTMAKDQASSRMREETRKAEEAALAARRVKA